MLLILKVHGVLIVLVWLMLAGFKIRLHNRNQWANPPFYFASPVFDYRYLLKYFDCLSSDKLRKNICTRQKLEEHTPTGEVVWVVQIINTVKSSAIFLQIRARLTFKTSAFQRLHDSLNSFFKYVESHPPLPFSDVLFHLCWHFYDIFSL